MTDVGYAEQRFGKAESAADVGTTAKPVRLDAQPLSLKTKLLYGSGAIAFGVKDNAFVFFLLLFYNQVLGLPAGWVGAALMIALIFDGLIDPLIGSVSDGWRSRLGRRHPFMYAAAIPAAIAYFLLWNPPARLHGPALLGYLIVTAVLVRAFVSIYEIPSTALAPELTASYDQRTSVFGYRTFLAWCGGLTMAVLGYQVFLKPGPGHPVGLLNPDGYATMGWVGALIIAGAILVSSIGTHRFIPHLRQPERAPSQPLRERVRALLVALSNRSLLFLLGAGFASGMSFGMASSLNIYVTTYFWALTNEQMAALVGGLFLGAALAFALTPVVARRFDKKTTAIGAGIAYLVINVGPILLRLADMAPPNGSTALLPMLIVCYVLTTGALVSVMILMSSMLADTVEDIELRSGKRAEGAVFSVNLLIQKCVSGAGVFAAGLVLSAIAFPSNASPGHVPAQTIVSLGLVFAAVQITCFVLTVVFLLGFRLGRAQHRANVEALRLRA